MSCNTQIQDHGDAMNDTHAQLVRSDEAKLVDDRFEGDLRPGSLVGSRGPGGDRRQGVDVEGVLSADNGALRIEPLLEPGWERACLSYGPFARQPGMILSAFILNGHNTSQAEPLNESFGSRLESWILGSRVFGGQVERVMRMLRAGGRIRRTLRRFRIWHWMASREVPKLDENMAVGWFPAEVSNPSEAGAAFVMHATGPNCGELWIREQDGFAPVVGSVQNLQLYYLVILRETDVIFYTSSVPRANSLGEYPDVRPVGISKAIESDTVWAGIHQSTLGQIGFRLDTRIYGVSVNRDADWGSRFAGAHFADDLKGSGLLDGRVPQVGEPWRATDGGPVLTGAGAVSGGHGSGFAEPGQPTGLLRCHLTFAPGKNGVARLRFRIADDGSSCCLELSQKRVRLMAPDANGESVIAVREIELADEVDIQILDSGTEIRATANGGELIEPVIGESRNADARGLGLELPGADGAITVREFEAHPRSIALPGFANHGKPWSHVGSEIIIADEFLGQPGELDGSTTTIGEKRWRKLLGQGEFRRDGNGALNVVATQKEPCAGRTMYAVDWDQGEFVDVDVEITPPGTARGQRENGLSGIVIWQDEDNYITINSWVSDGYDGASISCFFNVRGWEDLYDAIWSNVGSRIQHGVAYRMRVTADAHQYMVRVNDEPVLYRAYKDVYPDWEPLKIRSVGLITNWEWGLDTGSVFRDFTVRR